MSALRTSQLYSYCRSFLSSFDWKSFVQDVDSCLWAWVFEAKGQWRAIKFLRYQLRWLHVSIADFPIVFVLSELPFLLWLKSPFCKISAELAAMSALRTSQLYSYCLSFLSSFDWKSFLSFLQDVDICLWAWVFEEKGQWRAIKFLRYQLSWLHISIADLPVVFVLSERPFFLWLKSPFCKMLIAACELGCLKQRGSEEQSNSCVISWAGCMSALRTSQLYSYCRSFLSSFWLNLCKMLVSACELAVKSNQIPALSAAGCMSVLRTSQLYSYRRSFLSSFWLKSPFCKILISACELWVFEEKGQWRAIKFLRYQLSWLHVSIADLPVVFVLSELPFFLWLKSPLCKMLISACELGCLKKRGSEEQSNSCVISWAGCMSALRTSQLYSYCLSFLSSFDWKSLCKMLISAYWVFEEKGQLKFLQLSWLPSIADLPVVFVVGASFLPLIEESFLQDIDSCLWAWVFEAKGQWRAIKFLRYQLSWLHVSIADLPVVFVLSELPLPLIEKSFLQDVDICLWAWVFEEKGQWRAIKFLRYQPSWLHVSIADLPVVFVLSELPFFPWLKSPFCKMLISACELGCLKIKGQWRAIKFLRYQLSWLHVSIADLPVVFVLSELSFFPLRSPFCTMLIAVCELGCLKKRGSEEQSNSCVISWAGCMSALRTSQLYSYCLSFLSSFDWKSFLPDVDICLWAWVFEAKGQWRAIKFLRCQLSWLHVSIADFPVVFVLSELPFFLWLKVLCARCWYLPVSLGVWRKGAVKSNQIPALSAELAACQHCGPPSCIRIVGASFLPLIESPFCKMVTCACELGCLKKRGSEEQSNSCVISWAGCMSALRTSQLYSYCLSFLSSFDWKSFLQDVDICLWAWVFEEKGQWRAIKFLRYQLSWLHVSIADLPVVFVLSELPFFLWLKVLFARWWHVLVSLGVWRKGAVKSNQIPALSAELAACQHCGPPSCIRIVWAFFLPFWEVLSARCW